ncbi:MAG: AMIN domain-containing protein [Deltaproteobacteria bacterium]|nr:AMIN domain-containing protein [Deltaproteobacteria bacterium]
MTEKDLNLSSPINEPSSDDEAFQGFEDSDSLLWNTEFESLFDMPLQSEPWQEPVSSDHIDLPPDRVRFATLATLRLVDGDVRVDGVITNLSSEGLACVSAADFDPGTQIEISFQMELSNEPLDITAEVLWRRYPESGDPCYGLRFVELSQEQDEAIMGFIRERTEGRASEWTMPALPVLEGAAPRRRGRMALTASVGLAAGVALALMVALIPAADPGEQFGSDKVMAPTAAGVNFKTETEIQPIEKDLQPTKVEKVAAVVPVVEPKIEVEEPIEVSAKVETPVVEPQIPTLVKQEAVEVAKAEPVEVPATVKTKAGAVSSDGIVIDGDDGNVRLVLRTDGPVAKHKSFWLKNPRRFVVDVPGRRNAFDRLAYELNHPLAERLRVGQHADKVRFVVETSEDVLRKARLTPENDTLIIDLKRR